MIIPNHLPGVIEQKSEASHSEVAKCVVVLADGACHHPEIVKVEDELNELIDEACNRFCEAKSVSKAGRSNAFRTQSTSSHQPHHHHQDCHHHHHQDYDLY